MRWEAKDVFLILCEYTEAFAKEFISSDLCKSFPIRKAYFNYETESFVDKDYWLPYVLDEKGRPEFVLLTPCDILRKGEPAINTEDFYNSYDRIRMSIENNDLRSFISNYLGQAVRRYEEEQKKNKRPVKEKSAKKIEKEAFKEIVRQFPELYDYYVRLQEAKTEEIQQQCTHELNKQLERLLLSSKNLISALWDSGYEVDDSLSAREEAKKRLVYFKHIIEDCDGYKNLYAKGERISNENDLQRLFRYVWYGTRYKVDAEANNGRGQADFIISMGQEDQNIVEFKLASNKKLDHVFTQVGIYEAANCAEDSLIAIFYFTEEEHITAMQVVRNAGYERMIDDSIFLIDCRNNNKQSGSIA